MKKKKKPVLNEQETRQKLLGLASDLGFGPDLLKILNRYDNLLRNCTNELERQQIGVMANVEIHKLFGFRNALVVNGVEIIPGDPDLKGNA